MLKLSQLHLDLTTRGNDGKIYVFCWKSDYLFYDRAWLHQPSTAAGCPVYESSNPHPWTGLIHARFHLLLPPHAPSVMFPLYVRGHQQIKSSPQSWSIFVSESQESSQKVFCPCHLCLDLFWCFRKISVIQSRRQNTAMVQNNRMEERCEAERWEEMVGD